MTKEDIIGNACDAIREAQLWYERYQAQKGTEVDFDSSSLVRLWHRQYGLAVGLLWSLGRESDDYGGRFDDHLEDDLRVFIETDQCPDDLERQVESLVNHYA